MKRETKVIIFLASLFLSSSDLVSPSLADSSKSEVEDESHFTYETGKESGPEKWGKIDAEWQVCDTGEFQSPIDLTNERVSVIHDTKMWEKEYKPAPAVLHNRGHDIMVSWKGDAGQININGTIYKLKQCHWHSPSEHTINGTKFNMELHMVHESSEGTLAVVAILYTYGKADRFLSQLFHEIRSVDTEDIDVGIVNPADLGLCDQQFFRYMGSLTVPPCTEGVIWTIVKRVRTVSKEQATALREAVHDGFEENARPVQKLDGRTVWLYTQEENKAL